MDEQTIELSLAVIGTASVVMAALNGLLKPLERWAFATANTTDDKAVAVLANVLHVGTWLVGLLRIVAQPAALRGLPKKADFR